MLNPSTIKTLAPRVYADICEHEQDDAESRTPEQLDDLIRAMSPGDAINAFLEWNGIISYTDAIIELVRAVEAAAGDPK